MDKNFGELFSRDTTFRRGVGAASVLFMAACGSGDVETPRQSSEANPRLDVMQTDYLSVNGERVCSESRIAGLADSPVWKESYRLAAMEEELNSLDPGDGLRAALRGAGLTRVASCSDARTYERVKTEYLESLPTEVMDDADQPDSQVSVDKIAEGRTWFDAPTVQLRDPRSTSGIGFCTGVLISSSAMLTAAHCFDADGFYDTLVDYGTAQNKGCINPNGCSTQVICNPPGSCGYLTQIQVTRHPSYTGTGDTSDDIAVVRAVSGQAPSFWKSPANTSASWLPLLVSNVAGKGKLFWNVGYGASDHTGGGRGVGRLSNKQDEITWSTGNYWHANVVDGRGRPCRGDSGGPKINWATGFGLVIGIHSNSDKPDGWWCPDLDAKYRAAKVNTKIDWIEGIIGRCNHFTAGNGWAYARCW